MENTSNLEVHPEVNCPNRQEKISSQEESRSELAVLSSSTPEIDLNVTGFLPNDPDDPLNWSRARKWSMVLTISGLEFVAVIATSMCTPPAPQILEGLNSNNDTFITMLVSIWELGEAFAPLLIAPLSEIYGRLPIYHVANTLFVLFSIASALSSSISMLIIFRFLNGSTTAALSLNASVISDMFAPHERGSALAASYFPLLLGITVAPIIGGYVSEAVGWRWVFWLAAISGAVCEFSFILCFRESYKPAILKRRVKRSSIKHEEGCTPMGEPAAKIEVFRSAILRPAKLAMMAPVILLLSIYNGMVYGYSYLILTTMTQVFEKTYGVTEGTVGLMFLGKGIAGVFALLFLSMWDSYMERKKNSANGMKPEHRIPPMIIGGVVAPVALFLYGWTVEKKIHWIAPVVATGILAFSVVMVALSAYGYIADAFPIHVASAMASTVIAQSVIGALMPIAGPSLNRNLGIGWGSSLLGFLAVATLPIPLFVMSRYGERLRKRASV